MTTHMRKHTVTRWSMDVHAPYAYLYGADRTVSRLDRAARECAATTAVSLRRCQPRLDPDTRQPGVSPICGGATARRGQGTVGMSAAVMMRVDACGSSISRAACRSMTVSN